jgi:hypothetical protein
MIRLKLKLFSTNWINILGIFIAVYLSILVIELINPTNDLNNYFATAVIGGLFAIIFYGSMFWAGFILIMFILDVLLLNRDQSLLLPKLLLEWIIVSSPFIFWFIQYTEWIFLIAVCAFFITQYLRRKEIIRILGQISN